MGREGGGKPCSQLGCRCCDGEDARRRRAAAVDWAGPSAPLPLLAAPLLSHSLCLSLSLSVSLSSCFLKEVVRSRCVGWAGWALRPSSLALSLARSDRHTHTLSLSLSLYLSLSPLLAFSATSVRDLKTRLSPRPPCALSLPSPCADRAGPCSSLSLWLSLQTNCGRGWALSVLLRSVFANARPRSSFALSLQTRCGLGCALGPPSPSLAHPILQHAVGRLPGPTHRPPPSPACSRLPVHLPPAGHRPPDLPAARPAGWRRWPPAAACPPPARSPADVFAAGEVLS